ncbi:hypothetical protein, partial [Escherichia coli]|uniref:hypothetical protein n=1 Tax=Escherichia coli TaxID=562 RepID=UPI00195487A7
IKPRCVFARKQPALWGFGAGLPVSWSIDALQKQISSSEPNWIGQPTRGLSASARGWIDRVSIGRGKILDD